MDNPKKKKHDRKLIALGQRHEVYYWKNELGISKETLEQAVEETKSHSVRKIKQWLIDNGHITK